MAELADALDSKLLNQRFAALLGISFEFIKHLNLLAIPAILAKSSMPANALEKEA